MDTETNERPQQLKKQGKLPSWLRSPALLKWAIRLGWGAYRLWRVWNWFNHPDN